MTASEFKPLRWYIRNRLDGSFVLTPRGKPRAWAWLHDAVRWIERQERPNDFEHVRADWTDATRTRVTLPVSDDSPGDTA